MSALDRLVADELAQPLPPAVAAMAAEVARRHAGVAVLFYGSVLRTGDLTGMIDFYVLTDGGRRGGIGGRLWPDISFDEVVVGGGTLRAKVATMPLAVFVAAADDRLLDTTVWTRFVQPAALAWVRDGEARAAVVAAVSAAVRTASRYAAVLGDAPDHLAGLFAETYRAELRVEAPGRGGSILAFRPERWAPLLRAGWAANGWAVERGEPVVPVGERRRIARRWRRRRRAGRPLNLARLAKAAVTLDGAARYAAWKIERHTGLALAVTPWRERHPLLAAPGVLWALWRHRRAGA